MKTTKTSKKTQKQAKKGLQSSEVLTNKLALAKKIFDSRKTGLSFNALEAKYGLQKANGMTAYRIVNGYGAAAKDAFKKTKKKSA